MRYVVGGWPGLGRQERKKETDREWSWWVFRGKETSGWERAWRGGSGLTQVQRGYAKGNYGGAALAINNQP